MDKLYIASKDEFFLMLDEYFQTRTLVRPNSTLEEKPLRRLALTRQEAAAETGFCLSKIDQLIKSRQIKSTKVGRGVRIGWDEIENLINNNRSDRKLLRSESVDAFSLKREK